MWGTGSGLSVFRGVGQARGTRARVSGWDPAHRSRAGERQKDSGERRAAAVCTERAHTSPREGGAQRERDRESCRARVSKSRNYGRVACQDALLYRMLIFFTRTAHAAHRRGLTLSKLIIEA